MSCKITVSISGDKKNTKIKVGGNILLRLELLASDLNNGRLHITGPCLDKIIEIEKGVPFGVVINRGPKIILSLIRGGIDEMHFSVSGPLRLETI